MPQSVTLATINAALAWMDGPPSIYREPKLTAAEKEANERKAAERRQRAETKQKKLCAELLSDSPKGRWNSYVRSFRLWWNDCSTAEATPKKTPPSTTGTASSTLRSGASKPVPAAQKNPNQAAESEPKYLYHWNRFY